MKRSGPKSLWCDGELCGVAWIGIWRLVWIVWNENMGPKDKGDHHYHNR